MNIKNIRNQFALSQQEFADKLGVPKDRVAKWEQRSIVPKAEDYNKVMAFIKDNVPHETTGNFQKQLLAKKNSAHKEVPVYGGFTSLGNIEILDDENIKHKVVAQLPAEVFPGCDYAEKAKGDSMYPLIMNQALLVGKICPVKGISYGEKYIIKTKDGLDTTKFIHPGTDAGKIKLKAYNKSIPEQEIEMSDIIFVCRVQWIINPT